MTPIIIYLSGIIPGYLLFKNYMRKSEGEWTKGMRAIGIVIAIVLSWANLASWIFLKVIDNSLDNNKPAKW